MNSGETNFPPTDRCWIGPWSLCSDLSRPLIPPCMISIITVVTTSEQVWGWIFLRYFWCLLFFIINYLSVPFVELFGQTRPLANWTTYARKRRNNQPWNYSGLLSNKIQNKILGAHILCPFQPRATMSGIPSRIMFRYIYTIPSIKFTRIKEEERICSRR